MRITTTTVPTEAITSTIVNLYQNGRIEEGENLTRWAWANRLPVSVSGFATVWGHHHVMMTPAQDPAGTANFDEVSDGIEQNSWACTTDVNDDGSSRKRHAVLAIISDRMERLAREHFGSSLSNARKNAMMLELLSGHARAGQFDRILGEAQDINRMIELYQGAYDLITPLFMTHFAPTAMTPFEFETAIYAETATIYASWPACPACRKREFVIDDGFEVNLGLSGLDVAAICKNCNFPMTIAVEFV